MFRSQSLLATQIVPTVGVILGRRGFYVHAYLSLLPPQAVEMLTVRIEQLTVEGLTPSKICGFSGPLLGTITGMRSSDRAYRQCCLFLKPMIRRVKTSMTTITQFDLNLAESHGDRSTIQFSCSTKLQMLKSLPTMKLPSRERNKTEFTTKPRQFRPSSRIRTSPSPTSIAKVFFNRINHKLSVLWPLKVNHEGTP